MLSDNGEATKKTHIHVCVRVRPLIVTPPTKTKSPFIANSPATTTPHNRSSRLQSPTSSSFSKIRPPTSYSGLHKTGGVGRLATPTKVKKLVGNEMVHNAATNDSLHVTPLRTTAEISTMAWDVVNSTTLSQNEETNPDSGRTTTYSLDRVFGPSTRTHQIYAESIRPVVQASMEGYHGSVFAYGQTSTGKTYTMTGTVDEPGIVPLAVTECFQYIANDTKHNREFLLRVSYMEIYNEQITDLLSPVRTRGVASNNQQIRIFESRQEGVLVRGLREEVVTSPDQVYSIFASGEARRQTGSTNLNKQSSRSHSIFRILIESRERRGGGSSNTDIMGMASETSSVASSSADAVGPVRVSSLSLVDLAGSESVKISGATGARQKEGQYINKSLMTLGHVVYKLSEMARDGATSNSSTVHIPYRDSKLTRLLQPSLSGNAQICIICNISPQVRNLEESHNTLKFAVRAKRIQQHASVTEVVDDKTLLQSYREEIDALKKQLKAAQEAQRQLLEGKPPVERAGDEEDARVLVKAIQDLEKLILTTAPQMNLMTPTAPRRGGAAGPDESFFTANGDAGNISMDADGGGSSSGNGIFSPLSSKIPPTTEPLSPIPCTPESSGLVNELHRIQGLLGSVLQKRTQSRTPGTALADSDGTSPTSSSQVAPPANNSNISHQTPMHDAEVEQLRAKVQEQEVATSLREADSSFLQNQLAEKDKLLNEVAKILDAIEKRQVELEQENATLIEENSSLKKKLQNAMSTLSDLTTLE